jgi:hypothetical protein
MTDEATNEPKLQQFVIVEGLKKATAAIGLAVEVLQSCPPLDATLVLDDAPFNALVAARREFQITLLALDMAMDRVNKRLRGQPPTE